ncbi:hypothetical protein K3495_g3943 [Podosphaera aphanis]|nr:hypothetical protein K3495_g3943 [Podosphaera aphanis]
MTKKLKSLESILDEERKDILASLEGQPHSATSVNSHGSRVDGQLPNSLVRSMLDFNYSSSSPRGLSNNSQNGHANSQSNYMYHMHHLPPSGKSSPLSPRNFYLGSPRSLSVRSTQDLSATNKDTLSTPTETNPKVSHARSASSRRASDINLPTFGPRASLSAVPSTTDQSPWCLQVPPIGNTASKRIAKREKRTSMPSAVVDAVRGELLGIKDSGKHVISLTVGTGKNRTPHNYFGLRGSSPKPIETNKGKLDSLKAIQVHKDQRRRSTSHPVISPSILSPLSITITKKETNDGTLSSRSKPKKEVVFIEAEHAIADSSDDWESEEDILRGRNQAGRFTTNSKRTRQIRPRGKEIETAHSQPAEETGSTIISSRPEKNSDKLMPFELKVVVTEPTETHTKLAKPKVHPITSFDEAASGFNTPHDSEVEEGMSDIKRAQKLAINTTAVISTPATSRCVRSIYRGDFSKMQQEVRDNQRRVRKYLVATDLSEEATHALEWTIGTVLRDGDTLLAIYCVDEDLGITPNESNVDDKVQEQIAAIAGSAKLPFSSPILGPSHPPIHRKSVKGGSLSTSTTPDSSSSGWERSKAEQERYRAVQDITDRVSELLRKTKLQVKVVIEVIHCKNPKHLITEVIDYITPTLVILGSRGRSALKGVILGSFSNYIVAKSSVPVMVARKRLHKHTKYKRPSIRLANNLENPHPVLDSRTLVAARID